MTTLRHKDYQGSVEFEDGQLVIQVLHIDDTVTTTIDSASQAQAAFAELVDDYIATCEELGKQPGKPFKGTFNVRITPELHRQVAMSAADAGETMNAWISSALAGRIARKNPKGAAWPQLCRARDDGGRCRQRIHAHRKHRNLVGRVEAP